MHVISINFYKQIHHTNFTSSINQKETFINQKLNFMFKRIFSIALLLLIGCLSGFAQAPDLINYQGVARHTNGTAISNQNITLRLSVRQATSNGSVQYSETRHVNTNSDGLFNVQIGSAGTTSTTGSWSAITWDNAAKYLQVEMDTIGGSNFINMGTQQLVSVPYAQHAAQAATLSPGATVAPSQLSAGGATVNDILQYDGTNWVPSSIPSGTLSLPYNVLDPNIVSFAITNNSALGGSAIIGKTTTSSINASGLRGECTGIYGNAVFGKAAGTNAFGVLGQNTAGIGVKGLSTGTNGIGVYGETGNGTGVKGYSTVANAVGVFGESINGTGVKGLSNGTNAIGVYGESVNGTGVKGYGSDAGSVAVFGSSLSGTGVKAYSFTGKALEVVGDVRISGGAIAPSDGAVLTSDASGNASWKNVRVAFGARGINNSYQLMPHNVFQKVEFLVEDYDLNGNFIPTSGTSTSNTSVFTVPVSGVYHIDTRLVVWLSSSITAMDFAQIRIQRLRAGTTSTLLRARGYVNTSTLSNDVSEPEISSDVHLLTGDKIWIEIRQANDDNDPGNLGNSLADDDVWFRASLIIPD